jgi:hypothetical protein
MMTSLLFVPDRHEPPTDALWDPARVDAAIEHIVTRTRAAFDEHGHWPSHPDDLAQRAPRPAPNLYLGTAGVVWGLAQFGVRLPNDAALLRDAADASVAILKAVNMGDEYLHGLLLGPSGVHLVAYLLAADAATADALYAIVRANIVNPIQDFMWGAPGTMLAAKTMFDVTGETRWRDAFADSAAQIESELVPSPSAGIRVWMQHLYGFTAAHIGAGHGSAGNIAAVIVGRELLSAPAFDRWRTLVFATTRGTAIVVDDLANWPQSIDGHRPGRTQLLVQWCHGAPGMVIALGALCDGTDPTFDALMMQAGDLTWRAGPLRKGGGLCHGTAGNGYAFLRLFAQTQDERWLDRARTFAMHAIRQSEAAEQSHGDLRHSLWTGDIGTALYLRACKEPDPRFPTFHYF